MKIPKLNQSGITHILAPLLFIVLFAAVGGYVLLKGHAAPVQQDAATVDSSKKDSCTAKFYPNPVAWGNAGSQIIVTLKYNPWHASSIGNLYEKRRWYKGTTLVKTGVFSRQLSIPAGAPNPETANWGEKIVKPYTSLKVTLTNHELGFSCSATLLHKS